MTTDRHGTVRLREVGEADLPVFYEHQRDPSACRMAAFSPRARPEFLLHWKKILADEAIVKKTILLGEAVAGNVVCFEQSDKRLVGYWLGRSFWGRGVATRALSEFVKRVPDRPLHAYVAARNLGSIRVLEKCGFECVARRAAPGRSGGEAVEELEYALHD